MTKPEIIKYFLEILKITIPALVSIGVVLLARYQEKKKEYENKIRIKKVAIYEKFFMAQHRFIMEHSRLKSQSQKDKWMRELEEEIREFTKELMFWGSSEVIKAYNKLQQRMSAIDHKFEDYEDFYFALRKDIGHSNKKLRTFDLLKLMLKTDEFNENGRPKKSTLIHNNPDVKEGDIASIN